jgi:hypothetical protein
MRLLLPPVTTVRNAAQIANEIVAIFKTEFFNSIECIPVLQLSIFHFANLNVCFSQQRPFKAEENHEYDRPETARSGQKRPKAS